MNDQYDLYCLDLTGDLGQPSLIGADDVVCECAKFLAYSRNNATAHTLGQMGVFNALSARK